MKILDECLRIAKAHNYKHTQVDGYRHYSFIIQRNQIVEWGINQDGPGLPGYKPYQKRHSESVAYFLARGIMNKHITFDLVNVRLSKRHTLKLSKPCSCCLAWLNKLGCNKIYFTTEAGFVRLIR